jgi:hypothetical protein
MKKSILIAFVCSTLLFTFTGCEKEKPTGDDPNPCNTYFLNHLGDVETDVSIDRVSVLFQVFDENYKGVVGLDNVQQYSLTDYQDEMTTNSEASVTISPFGTIPTEIYTSILIDVSKSVDGLVGDIKDAASEFVKQSIAEQQIAIWTFDGETPKLRQNFTTNKAQLLSAISSIPETNLGTSTNLYEALTDAVNQLPKSNYTTFSITQSNILVFTDGKETANPTPLALSNAKNALSGTTVFVAALKSSDLDENTLKNQIASSQSNYFLANNILELKSKFTEIQNDIEKLSKSVYWLFYTSPRKGQQQWNINLKLKENCNTTVDSEIRTAYWSTGF